MQERMDGLVGDGTYSLRRRRQTPGCSNRRQSRYRTGCSRRRSLTRRRRMLRPWDSSPPARALCQAPRHMSPLLDSSCWGSRPRRSFLSQSDMTTDAFRGVRGLRLRGGRGPSLGREVSSVLDDVVPPPRQREPQTADVRAALRRRWLRGGGSRRLRGRCGLLLRREVSAVSERGRRGPGRRSTRGGIWRLGLAASCGLQWAGVAAESVAQLVPARGLRSVL
jgi:hypothetical protein